MIGYQVPTKLLNLFPFKLNRAEMENDSLVEIKQFMRKKTEFALAQKRKKKKVYSLLNIQIYTFSLITIIHPYTDIYDFPLSWASSTSPVIQKQAIPSGWVIRTGKAAHSSLVH